MSRIAIVVGGAGGIGRAIVQRCAEAGDRVFVFDRRPAEAIENWVQCDQGDEEGVLAAFTQFDEMTGRRAPDYIVCVASISRRQKFLDATVADIDEMLRVNVRGLAQVAQEAARRMKPKRKGTIIVITSVAAVQAWAMEPFYSVTKAAQVALVRSMAIELAPFGVSANAVGPGPIDVASVGMAATRNEPGVSGKIIDRTPAGRFGQPSEVAEAVHFLSRSTWITGQTIYVDGGYLASGLAYSSNGGEDD